MDVFDKILNTFKINHIKAGQILPRSELSKTIHSLSIKERLELKDVWHTILSSQIAIDGNPEGPMLTEIGEGMVYK